MEINYFSTAKSAEIFVVNFGIKGFNQALDDNGDRDIMQINEKTRIYIKECGVLEDTLSKELS